MSKIVPKSMQSQSSQNMKSNKSRNENSDRDVMFAALFGGAREEQLSDKSSICKSLMGTMGLTNSGDDNSHNQQPSDDLMALNASIQGGRGVWQKTAELQGDVLSNELELGQIPTSLNSENSDALAIATVGMTSPETQGGTIAMPRSGSAVLANEIFGDGVGPNGRTGSAGADVLSNKTANVDRNNLLGKIKTSADLGGPERAVQNSTIRSENFAGNMENTLTKNMTNDIAKLQALRAANLEHQNADIDEESAKADLDELIGKLGKNGLNANGQQQRAVTVAISPVTGKAAPFGELGRGTNEVTRSATASSSVVDNSSAIAGSVANGSSNGQSGAQNGQQGSSQAAPQSGSSLLGNLNNLQILDMAKDNWTEMLLQRVKNGLSGGRDQLDFQLNPRNLGKMRISIFMQNNRTNIHIQTETLSAASMLGESEARLAQMLEASGLRLGNLNSGQFDGFGGAGSEQQNNKQSENKTGSFGKADNGQGDEQIVAETIATGSDNLINIQA